MRLRRLLMATVALLLLFGLVVADVATYSSLRSYLYGRLDEQLDVAQHQSAWYFHFIAQHDRAPRLDAFNSHLSPDVYAILLDHHGRPILRRPSGTLLHPDPTPVLPRRIRITSAPRQTSFGRAQGVYRPNPDSFDLAAVGTSGPTYRAVAFRVPQGLVVVAVAVAATTDTLRSLVRVELIASVAVVLVGCLAGAWIVRRELRPLESMARTAGAIAGGDLGQRVPAGSERSEVGRLGLALNGMLSQIQAAFDEKSRSEAHLRQFVADASHELRTPLTSIRGYTELLRKGAFTEGLETDRALARVEEEAARMGLLVDDLLLLARLDQGRPLERVPVDLSAVCADALDAARAVDPGRLMDLAIREPVVVLADPQRLRQAVDNLVRNALVHTPAGTAVHVSVERRGVSGRCLVADDGPGIDPALQARVFDRFSRGDSARTGQGTGLGLAIVRAIAEALGGSAEVRSRPGAGACFVLTLPLAGGSVPSGPSATRASTTPWTSPEAGGGRPAGTPAAMPASVARPERAGARPDWTPSRGPALPPRPVLSPEQPGPGVRSGRGGPAPA